MVYFALGDHMVILVEGSFTPGDHEVILVEGSFTPGAYEVLLVESTASSADFERRELDLNYSVRGWGFVHLENIISSNSC